MKRRVFSKKNFKVCKVLDDREGFFPNLNEVYVLVPQKREGPTFTTNNVQLQTHISSKLPHSQFSEPMKIGDTFDSVTQVSCALFHAGQALSLLAIEMHR